ncbi:hypothetical protein KAX06_09050 [candidate division WOR-3 bacterium]|nr:hypothetical protein [candidate division WOR-3 bacterium]
MPKESKAKQLIKKIRKEVEKLEKIVERHPEAMMRVENIKNSLEELDKAVDFSEGSVGIVKELRRR